MTLTQVSTWFANARRRLKKENSLKDEEDDRTESSIGEDTSVCRKTNIFKTSLKLLYTRARRLFMSAKMANRKNQRQKFGE